jgi:ParB family chromosome partitioning protein
MFANVLGSLEGSNPVQAPSRAASPHLVKVAAGVRQIQEKGEALDKILKDGDHIVDVAPDDVAPSAIPDRFDGAYEAHAIDELVASMKERGQIVPGLIRPQRGGDKPYQIVYGRRRLAAAKTLGVKFRAIVRELTDDEAIVYQGEENTNRNDLSFIEKCAFALSQEQAGFRREIICASLATGKSHVSEMLRIASSLPRNILTLIGAAPEIGRRRWISFEEAFNPLADAQERVGNALANHDSKDSNERFQIAHAALTAPTSAPRNDPLRVQEIRANGFLLATASYPSSGARLNFAKSVPAEFVEFLNSRMEALHSEFVKTTTNK